MQPELDKHAYFKVAPFFEERRVYISSMRTPVSQICLQVNLLI